MKIKGEMLKVPIGHEIYKYLAEVLSQYCKEPECSKLFIVEGTKEKPRIGIRYPGKKLHERKLKRINKNSVLWANLLDFLVVPFKNGIEQTASLFNYRNLLVDFETHKKHNDLFWEMILELYEKNTITKVSPKLDGVESRLFLEMLKWMWIQEDLNYKLSHSDVESKIKYALENKSGSATSRGAGRAKFFAALFLVRDNHFNSALATKIVLS